MKAVFLTTVLLLGVLVHTSEAVDCYECNTVTGEKNCEDPYSSPEAQIQTECTYCSKTKAVVSGSQTLARSCVKIGPAAYIGCESGSQGGTSASICFCDTDKCNGASHVTITFTSLIVVLFAYWLQ